MRYTIALERQPPSHCSMPAIDVNGYGFFYEGLDEDGDCDDCWPNPETADGIQCPVKPGEAYEGAKVIAVGIFLSPQEDRWLWEVETEAEPLSRVSCHTNQFVHPHRIEQRCGTVGELVEHLKTLPPSLPLDSDGVDVTWVNIGSDEAGMLEHLNIERP